MRWPKCKGEEETKNGFKNGIKRYKCKTCGCNYTKSTPHGYPIELKREALRYYLEEIGFRRIERLPGVSRTTVMYRVKKADEKIKDIAFIEQKMDIVVSRAIFTKYKGFLCWG